MKEQEDIRSLQWSVGLYALVLAMKVAVYFMTGILAVLAEALHTLSDIFVPGFLLIAAYYSHLKPDDIHMFGHGRAQ